MGDMSELYTDFYDDYDHDGEDQYDIICNRCGETGLHGQDTGARWMLVDDYEVAHVCKHIDVTDDFEDLTT